MPFKLFQCKQTLGKSCELEKQREITKENVTEEGQVVPKWKEPENESELIACCQGQEVSVQYSITLLTILYSSPLKPTPSSPKPFRQP